MIHHLMPPIAAVVLAAEPVSVGDLNFNGVVVGVGRDSATIQDVNGALISVPLDASTYLYDQQSPIALAALEKRMEVRVVTVWSRSKAKRYVCIYILTAAPGHPLS